MAAVLAASLACSGSPTTPRVTPPTAVVDPPTTTTTTTTLPAAAASCPKGTVDTYCSRGTATFLEELDKAIDKVVEESPVLFDKNDLAGPREYKIKDLDLFYGGVIKHLQAQGLCAGFDLKEIQIKRDNAYNDQYDIVLGSGHIRRGLGSYRNTCSPAAFPLDPQDVIAQVRVGFFGIRCPDDRVPPRNGEGKLPVGCTGSVTASPKNKNGDDVDYRIHGTQITWTFDQEGDFARMGDDPASDFNKFVIGRNAGGDFDICATVKEVKGCMRAAVIP
ncbi:MAG TPA: hypothetical protein VF310_16980 [Vicinamibacteria bacterium]